MGDVINQTTVKLNDGRVARVLTPTLTSRSVQIQVFNNETGRYETSEIYKGDPLYEVITGGDSNTKWCQAKLEEENTIINNYMTQARACDKQASIFEKLSNECSETAYNLMRENNLTSIAQVDTLEDKSVKEDIETNYNNSWAYRFKKISKVNESISNSISAFIRTTGTFYVYLKNFAK